MRTVYIVMLVLALGMLAAVSCTSHSTILDPGNQPAVFLPTTTTTATQVSTVPANGDVNPYGVAFVPTGFPTGGLLSPGDILVSNFNAVSNLQGTGTTIVKITPAGQQSLFFQGTGLGLSTALVVLRKGFVIVGNLPAPDGTFATATAGGLLILDKNGNLVTTLADNTTLDGPWDMTAVGTGAEVTAFVSCALSGKITRVDMLFDDTSLVSHTETIIADGYTHNADPVAFVVAPTGLVYEHLGDVLYVASTGDNAVYRLDDVSTAMAVQSKGSLVYADNAHLHGPLGMVRASNGHLLVSNNDTVNSDTTQPSEIVEFTTEGQFIAQLSVDPAQGGSFGMDIRRVGDTATFAAVDDATSMLLIWTINIP
jgi:hypothetical protein